MDNLQDITPEGSVVPVYLAHPSSESIEDERLRAIEFEASAAQIQAQLNAKQSALAKLSSLGLTEEEARAIIGI